MFFRRKNLKHPEVKDQYSTLLAELDTIGPSRQHDVAEKLLIFWDAFVEVFGSPDNFRKQPRAAQDAYIAKFASVADRTRLAKNRQRGHLHYSVELMLRYLLVLRDNDHRRSAMALSARVVRLINGAYERRSKSRKPPHLVDVSSSKILDALGRMKSELFVENAIAYPEPRKRPRIVRRYKLLSK